MQDHQTRQDSSFEENECLHLFKNVKVCWNCWNLTLVGAWLAEGAGVTDLVWKENAPLHIESVERPIDMEMLPVKFKGNLLNINERKQIKNYKTEKLKLRISDDVWLRSVWAKYSKDKHTWSYSNERL